jgi:hypothetical protein
MQTVFALCLGDADPGESGDGWPADDQLRVGVHGFASSHAIAAGNAVSSARCAPRSRTLLTALSLAMASARDLIGPSRTASSIAQSRSQSVARRAVDRVFASRSEVGDHCVRQHDCQLTNAFANNERHSARVVLGACRMEDRCSLVATSNQSRRHDLYRLRAQPRQNTFGRPEMSILDSAGMAIRASGLL